MAGPRCCMLVTFFCEMPDSETQNSAALQGLSDHLWGCPPEGFLAGLLAGPQPVPHKVVQVTGV